MALLGGGELYGMGRKASVDSPCSSSSQKSREGLFGEHCVGGLCAEWSSLLKAGELGFSSCTKEGAMSRGCTVPAHGEGVPASPGDSVSEGVCWAGSDYLLTDLSWLQLLG